VITPIKGGDVADVEFQDGDDFSIGGFVQVPVALLEDNDLGDGAILTYAVIADQGTGTPSQQEMADVRGIRRPAFSSHVNDLVKQGYLEVRKEG
jgi:DNA-binding MarR family transcriptional regulator